MPTRTLLAAITVATLALSGCAGDADDTTATTNQTAAGETGATTTTVEGCEHSAADVMFSRMMIPHNQQAIEMSDIILAKDDVPADVRTMAEEIKAARGPEIEQMRQWLEQWGAPGGPGPEGGPRMDENMGEHGGGHGDGHRGRDRHGRGRGL